MRRCRGSCRGSLRRRRGCCCCRTLQLLLRGGKKGKQMRAKMGEAVNMETQSPTAATAAATTAIDAAAAVATAEEGKKVKKMRTRVAEAVGVVAAINPAGGKHGAKPPTAKQAGKAPAVITQVVTPSVVKQGGKTSTAITQGIKVPVIAKKGAVAREAHETLGASTAAEVAAKRRVGMSWGVNILPHPSPPLPFPLSICEPSHFLFVRW